MKSQIGILLCTTFFSTSASAGYVQNFVDLHGGCQNGVGTLTLLEEHLPSTDGRFLEKNARDWTDEELDEYRRVYTACLRLHPGEVMKTFRVGEPIVAPPGAIEAKVDERIDEVMRREINPARASQRQEEASLAARKELEKGKERFRVNAERDAAKRREAAADDRRELERAREDERRVAAQEQARRDRQAADHAGRLAELEAPKIAATEREASEAHRARVAAERHLDEVRKQVATARNQRAAEDAAVASAKAKRLQIERQEAKLALERQEDDALAKTCSVSAHQFGRLELGMNLRQVRQTLGCFGSLQTSTQVEGIGAFAVYRWDGARSGSAIATTFTDGRLVSKTQSALD